MNRELEIRERVAQYGLALAGTDKAELCRARHELEFYANADLRYLLDETARLRADLAAMTAERDEMRERAEAAERDINCMLRDVNPFVRCKACGMLAGFGCVAEICAKEAYWRGPVKNKEGV